MAEQIRHRAASFSVEREVAVLGVAGQTYLGMLVGCNLGMVLSTATLRPIAAPLAMPMTRLVCCNAGMMLGMILTEALLPAAFIGFAGVPGPVRMFIVMVLGMTAGMWGGWWSAKWVLAGWRRWVRPAARAHLATTEFVELKGSQATTGIRE